MEENVSYQRMQVLKAVELADFTGKNTKRIRILKTVELAEKCQKNENFERMKVRMLLFGRAN